MAGMVLTSIIGTKASERCKGGNYIQMNPDQLNHNRQQMEFHTSGQIIIEKDMHRFAFYFYIKQNSTF